MKLIYLIALILIFDENLHSQIICIQNPKVHVPNQVDSAIKKYLYLKNPFGKSIDSKLYYIVNNIQTVKKNGNMYSIYSFRFAISDIGNDYIILCTPQNLNTIVGDGNLNEDKAILNTFFSKYPYFSPKTMQDCYHTLEYNHKKTPIW